MVGTRTSKVGRLEGLPSVRRLGDGPVDSEDDDSGDDADAWRRGRSTLQTGPNNPDRTVERVRQTAERSRSHRVAMLSDRRCVYRSQTHVLSCRRRYDPRAATRLLLDHSWIPALRRVSLSAHCRQEPSVLVEGIEHTFWFVRGEDGSDRLPARSRVRAKVRLATCSIG